MEPTKFDMKYAAVRRAIIEQRFSKLNDKQRQETYAQMLVRLSRSNFRSRFHLKVQDKQYIREKGWNTVADHAADFVSKRLAPAEPKNDGKQTPMRGHPVFIAQHATACCCRGCLAKWHGIPQGVPLSAEQQVYIVGMLMSWMRREMEN